MTRYLTERLMTVEEAQRLSDPHTSREENEKRRRQWSWQSVEGAMSQTVSDETLDRMESLRLRK
jgi:hypothetical protein